jgi:ABC-type cobalt transport system substrate-binding protein
MVEPRSGKIAGILFAVAIGAAIYIVAKPVL